MRTAPHPLPILLRWLALAVLLAGMVINPVLAFAGDIHSLDHAPIGSDTDGHSHAADHSHGPTTDVDSGTVDAGTADDGDAEESGVHDLMHLAHGCAPAPADGAAVSLPTFLPLTQKVDSPFIASLAPLRRVSEPFRPPIS